MTPSGIMINRLFPFLENFGHLSMRPASFSVLAEAGNVELTAVTFQRGKKHDYLLFLVPEKSGISIPFPASESAANNLKHEMSFFGYSTANIMVKNGGVKRFTSTDDSFVANRVLVTLEESPGKNCYMMIPEYFLAAVFRYCGILHDGAADIEKPVVKITDEMPLLDLSVLHSRNRLFVNYSTLINKIGDNADISLFTKSLLESGYVDYNHLAAMCGFYPWFGAMLERASKNNFEITMKLYRQLEPLVAKENPSSMEWKSRLDYQVQNVISKLVFGANPDIPRNIFYSERIKSADSVISGMRLAWKEKRFPFASLMEYFLSMKNAAWLINAGTRARLVTLAALEYGADFAALYRKFGQDFRVDFISSVRKEQASLKNMSNLKRQALLTQNLLEFRSGADDYLMDNVIRRKSPMGLNALYDMMLSLDAESAVILYNLAGYERFVSVFDAFKYIKSSPVSAGDADRLFDSVSAMLPFAERGVCRDIYYEKINRDRIINDNTHDRAIRDISHALMFMDETNLRGETHDKKITL